MSIGSNIPLPAEKPRLARVSRTGQTGHCPNKSRIGLLRTGHTIGRCLITAVLAAGMLALLIRISRVR